MLGLSTKAKVRYCKSYGGYWKARIYPLTSSANDSFAMWNRTKVYFNLCIFNSVEGMYKYKGCIGYSFEAEAGDRSEGSSAQGMVRACLTSKENSVRKLVIDPCIGEILLDKGELCEEVIAHEAAHAALWCCGITIGHGVLGLTTMRATSESEEQFCYMVGTIVSDIAIVCNSILTEAKTAKGARKC